MTRTNAATRITDRELADEQAWALLSSEIFGRLALQDSRTDELGLVSFTVEDRTLVFRTLNGTALQRVLDDTWIEFQAAAATPVAETWTVRARGRAEVIEHPSGDADYVRLRPSLVRARYFRGEG